MSAEIPSSKYSKHTVARKCIKKEAVFTEDNHEITHQKGHHSDGDSDELFSDEDDAKNNISPHTSKVSICSSLNITETSINIQLESPGKPVVPKTPLSLVPFLSKANYQWTSDLETPQSNKRVDEPDNTTDKSAKNIGCTQQGTPQASTIKNMASDDISCSPVIMSRKTRKRPKRQIFNTSVSISHQNEDCLKSTECTEHERTKMPNYNSNHNIQQHHQQDDIKLLTMGRKNEYRNKDSNIHGSKKCKEICTKAKVSDKFEIEKESQYSSDNCDSLAFQSFSDATFSDIDRICATDFDKNKESHSISINNKKDTSNIIEKNVNLIAGCKRNESKLNNKDLTLNNEDSRNIVKVHCEDTRDYLNVYLKSLTECKKHILQSTEKYNDVKIPSGFLTASGHPVNVSQTALGKATHLFSEETENNLQIPDMVDVVQCHKKDNTVSCINAKMIRNVGTEERKNSLRGYKTNDSDKFSGTKALTLNQIEEIGHKEMSSQNNTKDEYKTIQTDFTTDSNPLVKDLSKELLKPQDQFSKEIDTVSYAGVSNAKQPNNDNNMSLGFKTASGEPIKISSKALSRAQTLFSDDLEKLSYIDELRFNHTSNDDKLSHISYTTVGDQSNNSNQQKNSDSVSCMSFTTTNGQATEILDETLLKTRRSFSNELDNIYSKEILRPTYQNNENKNPLIGFTTDNGQPVKISHEAFVEAKTLLSDPTDEDLHKELSASNDQSNENKIAHVGFTAGRGQPMTISHEALLKAKTLLSDPADEDPHKELSVSNEESNENNVADVGFTAGRGQPVTISHEALLKAKTLLSDPDDEDPQKELSVSNDQSNENKVTHVGFTTGRGQPVKISHEALSNAKTLLLDPADEGPHKELSVSNDQSNENKVAHVGFTTGRGQPVKISHEALSKAKTLLSDPADENPHKKLSVPDDQNNDSKILIVGLKSDRNQSMNIIKKALTYSTTLLWNETSCEKLTRSISEDNIVLCKRKRVDDANFLSTSENQVLHNQKKVRRSDDLYICKSEELFPEEQKIKKCSEIQADKEELVASAIALLEDEESQEGKCTKDVSSINGSPIMGQHKKPSLRKCSRRKLKYNLCQTEVTYSPTALNSKEQLAPENSDNVNNEAIDEQIEDFSKHEKQGKELNQPSSEYGDTQAMMDFIEQSADILQKRIQAAMEQDKVIELKKRVRPKPITGRLLSYKEVNHKYRITWQDITGGSTPKLCTYHELIDKHISPQILNITAHTAVTYKFNCADFYGHENVQYNVDGVNAGSANLILDENGYAGVVEIARAFLASPGVDPTLVPQGWIENHYKWIVWKLASMDRMNFNLMILPRALTPAFVMEQLKYRYDREIDRSERPALRKILEKDDVPSRMLVLCVSSILKETNIEDTAKNPALSGALPYKLELTDGWYSIPASIDLAMTNYIKSNKIREGTKLITYGAELLSCDQGCSPLEVPADVRLKIYTNSTRRAKWDAKLGYYSKIKTLPILLKDVSPNGGLVSKIKVTVARTYPLLYHEKSATGESIFRNSRCEEKVSIAFEKECRLKAEALYAEAEETFSFGRKNSLSSTDDVGTLIADWDNDCEQLSGKEFLSKEQYEEMLHNCHMKQEEFKRKLESKLKESLPSPRKVSPVLKVRVTERETCAVLSVWSPSEDITTLLKEGHSIVILNAFACGKRGNEIQLTAGRNALFNLHSVHDTSYVKRRCTLLHEITDPSFNPPYSEFDTVGIVVSVVSAPYGMKNFEAVNLAHPCDTSSSYLSILFWQGVAVFGYTEILTVGSFVACSNIEWRQQSTLWNIPLAYCTERSLFTRNPRQAYLQQPFDNLKNIVKNSKAYVAQCVAEISTELEKKSPRKSFYLNKDGSIELTPNSSKQPTNCSSQMTPEAIDNIRYSMKKTSVQKRLEKLQCYGEPPELTPLILPGCSKRASLDFRSPVRKVQTNMSTNNLNSKKNNT